MVRRTETLPMLNENFINYGFNKVEWIENLRYLGYEFYILSQSFAIDVPHELYDKAVDNDCRSTFAINYKQSFKDENPEMLKVYRRFLEKMRKEENDESRQVLCLSKRRFFTRRNQD